MLEWLWNRNPSDLKKVGRGVYRTPNTRSLDELFDPHAFTLALVTKCEYDSILKAIASAAVHYGYFVGVDPTASTLFLQELERRFIHPEELAVHPPALVASEHLVRETLGGKTVYSLSRGQLDVRYNPFGTRFQKQR